MRIHRIRLKNFCGVVESEACFAPRGVTIVEGPNEVGKSTLLQALDLLFDYRDDSRSEDVRAAKPVDRDVGAEVMVDLEMGGCDLTYFKRFNRDCETRLSVRTPKAENLTGREAHDRVQQLLDESDALLYVQIDNRSIVQRAKQGQATGRKLSLTPRVPNTSSTGRKRARKGKIHSGRLGRQPLGQTPQPRTSGTSSPPSKPTSHGTRASTGRLPTHGRASEASRRVSSSWRMRGMESPSSRVRWSGYV